MHFSRLRLSGFKSFVDPTELHIEPGLTGVVGPNGCGKSNLLEAIRWVMGENRVKSLRGGAMDDIIFAGTDKRPPRNMAEVSLVLDNLERNAPAGYNDHDMIEVSRRIERESGSAYRINGKDVRAKDVQLLFADAATGAHSPALVSQGRIGNLISAKAKDRRLLLEEAAGISGLHSRRREAEQRLRGAETNLLRLQDVVNQMETQIASLKRQARQATRYREISDEIRRAEASLLYLKWSSAADEVVRLENELHGAKAKVADATAKVASLTTEQAELAAKLPDMRNAAAAAAAAVQRLTIARDNLDNEENRRESLTEELEARLIQIEDDKIRESEISSDARLALERLLGERRRLETARDAEQDSAVTAKETLEIATREASAAEEAFDQLSQRTAAARARRESLESDILAIERRLDMLAGERSRLCLEMEQLSISDESTNQMVDAEKAVTSGESAMKKALSGLDQAEAVAQQSRQNLEAAQNQLSEKRGGMRGLEAEVNTLKAMLADVEAGDAVPLSRGLSAKSGFEKAAGAALGDDVEASENADEARHWQTLSELENGIIWPDGVKPLSDFVTAPKALTRRIATIGVVMDDDVDGATLASDLTAGLRLVSKAGDVWRWDGFVMLAGAPSHAAMRLEQGNRLGELEGSLATAAKALNEAEKVAIATQKIDAEAREAERNARQTRDESEKTFVQVQRHLVSVEQESSRRVSRLNSLKEADERLAEELRETKTRVDAFKAKIAELPDTTKLDTELAEDRSRVEGLRQALGQARGAYDSLKREAESRNERLAAITTESGAWQLRVDSASKHLKELDDRLEETKLQLKAMLKGPENIDGKRIALLEELEKADEVRKLSSDTLVTAEQALASKDGELRAAQVTLNEVRERQIRLDAGVEAASERRKEVALLVGERFDCPPTHVLEKVGVESSDDLEPQSSVEVSLERLKRERDRLGAVNLRAEEELGEIDEQIGHMISERNDLEEAIARLRGAINSLNKEGRERLLAAFEEVNQHFIDLFRSLFGGGEAHLKLTESEDPLDAGLEIFASPPGKKMQSLSLLSGGEQTLTATSLIFAVFMTNPAPICVLDEVDAPLDDANVERFCNLLDDMRARTDTRFLIVTHNALTMSRMSRLFGVTMAERGVSQLVSVDLEEASEIVEAG